VTICAALRHLSLDRLPPHGGPDMTANEHTRVRRSKFLFS
ncbi:hypothetical protein BMAJHU_C0554, partial [Burkholderia mallei JHU]